MLAGLLICFGILIVFGLYRIDQALCGIAQHLEGLRHDHARDLTARRSR